MQCTIFIGISLRNPEEIEKPADGSLACIPSANFIVSINSEKTRLRIRRRGRTRTGSGLISLPCGIGRRICFRLVAFG
jgi:hypothetical protein